MSPDVSTALAAEPNPTRADDPPFERIDGDRRRGLLLLCDHASNRVPPPYGDLGLPAAAFERHIAYDIGCAAMTHRLAHLSGAPALMTRFTRLLIDPNRGEDDPTLVMRLSDGAVVPGNARVDAAERDRRIALFHRPYHDAIAAELDAMLAVGVIPAVVSLHSFTPAWKQRPRPWHVGILWDVDSRLNVPLIEAMRAAGDLVVGDNEPYDGGLKNDTIYRHCTRRGLANTLIEVRQDLIAAPEEAAAWGDRLWEFLEPLLADHHMHESKLYGSRTGQVVPWPGRR